MIFLRLHYNHFFPSSSRSDHLFLVILLYLCHLNHQRMRLVWSQMSFYFRLIFYLAMQEEVLFRVSVLTLLWGHLMLFSLLILWIAHLEYKYLLVTNSSCCHTLILMGNFVLWRNPSPFIALKAFDAFTINTVCVFFVEYFLNCMNSCFTAFVLSWAKL